MPGLVADMGAEDRARSPGPPLSWNGSWAMRVLGLWIADDGEVAGECVPESGIATMEFAKRSPSDCGPSRSRARAARRNR